jgi:hypothetical protein
MIDPQIVDEFWNTVITGGAVPESGLCEAILKRWFQATYPGKNATHPAKPANKETLAEILQDYSPDAIRHALEHEREHRDEMEWQRFERQSKQGQFEREQKERSILLSELAVLKPRHRGLTFQPYDAGYLYNASNADLERMPLPELRQGVEKLRAAVQGAEQRIQAEEAALRARAKQERDASPIINAADLDTIEPCFRYREPSERNLAAAETELCKYDRINLNYLHLLLALKGAAQQGQDTDALIVLVRGDTGAGKNATLLLAADMLCCGLIESKLGKERDALLSAYATAGATRAFAVCNEVQDVWPGHLKVLPHLTKGASYKIPYSRAESVVEQAAVFVMTAKTLPNGLLTDPALARRTIFVDLGIGARGIDWRAVASVKGWRQRHPDAADDFISRELERFQEGKTPTARQIAAELGFGMLSDHLEQVIRDFANKLEHPSKHSRYSGEGWRVINRGARGRPSGELWREFDLLKPAIDELCEVVYPTGKDRRVFIRFPFLKTQEVPSLQVAAEQGG